MTLTPNPIPLATVIETLEARKVPGATMHPDDLGLRVSNDLLDDLIEEFLTWGFENAVVSDENDVTAVHA